MKASEEAPRRRTRARALVAALVGFSAFLLWMWHFSVIYRPFGDADFAQQWFAARVLWAGGAPYAAVGPGRAFEWPSALMYPATGLLAVSPLAWLPKSVATATFAGLGAAALAFALSARGWYPLLVFGSLPYYYALSVGQWSPLLAASAVLPGLAWVVAAKPSIGLAIAVYSPTKRWLASATTGGVALLLVSLALRPGWIAEWLIAMREPPSAMLGDPRFIQAMYRSPVACPGGWITLLALLRWRRPEARLLAVLACVPQTMAGYELVAVLALIPRNFVQSFTLGLASWGAWLVLVSGWPYASWDIVFQTAGQLSVWFTFVPATVFILLRSNEGELPSRLETLMEKLRQRSARFPGGPYVATLLFGERGMEGG